jgi:hypothetical protein
MSETRRLLEAATALSHLLGSNQVPHAFHGSILTAVLANSTHSDVSFCLAPCCRVSFSSLIFRKYTASLKEVHIIPSVVSVTLSLGVRILLPLTPHGPIGEGAFSGSCRHQCVLMGSGQLTCYIPSGNSCNRSECAIHHMFTFPV